MYRFRNHVLRVLLLLVVSAGFSATMAAAMRSPNLLIIRLSPERPPRYLEDASGSWKAGHNGGHREPEMEVHLLKGHAAKDDLFFADDYKFEHEFKPEANAKRIPARFKHSEKERTLEDEDENENDDASMPDEIIQPIGSRNIIHVPDLQCPRNERRDRDGRCRQRV